MKYKLSYKFSLYKYCTEFLFKEKTKAKKKEIDNNPNFIVFHWHQ